MNTKTFKPSNHKLAQAVALAVLAVAANQAQATDYSFSDLGTMTGPYIGAGANGVNNAGQVAGYGVVNNRYVPYVWNGDVATQQDLGPNGEAAISIGINNAGQTAGYYFMANDSGQVALRYDGTTAVALDGFPNGNWYTGFAINNHGQVVGNATIDPQFDSRALRWDGTAVTQLGTLGGNQGFAYGINDAGQVVGFASTPGDNASRAVYWNGTAAVDLGTLGGTNSSANGINNAGQIAGNAYTTNDAVQHAALWNSTTSAATDLGSLALDSNASAINNLGQIVGSSTMADGLQHATLWDGGHIIDLNKYLPSDLAILGWNLYQSQGISDTGIIVGWAEKGLDPNTAQWGSFKLTPSAVPVPGAVWLFGSALAGFVGMNRRKQEVAA